MSYQIFKSEKVPEDVLKRMPMSFSSKLHSAAFIGIKEEKDVITACLTAGVNGMHPAALYLDFYFEYLDDKTVYENLFDRVKSLKQDVNYIISVERVSDALLSFLTNNQFFELRRTYWCEVYIDTYIQYFETENHSSKQTAERFEFSDEDIHTMKSVYAYTHRMHPPESIVLNKWREMIESELDTSSSVILRDAGGHLTGYILIYDGNHGDEKEIGWCYFNNKDTQSYLERGFKDGLYSMRSNGVKKLWLELDTSDTFGFEIFGDFIHHRQVDVYTFMKRGSSIEVSEITVEDVLTVHEWTKDKIFCERLGWSVSESIEDTKKWWHSIIRSQDESFIREKISMDDTMIGYIDQYHLNDRIELGIAIGNKKYRGEGIGTYVLSQYAMALSERYTDKDIIALVETDNIPSQRMLIKSGFKSHSGDEGENLYIFDRYRT